MVREWFVTETGRVYFNLRDLSPRRKVLKVPDRVEVLSRTWMRTGSLG